MKVVVIGGGAAGCMAALTSARLGNNVILIEKNNELGKKIKITGKGRCNLTFDGDFNFFQKNINVNNKFMYSSFNNFSNIDTLQFFNELGVETKLERGSRYFLKSDDASELVYVLKKELEKAGVEIIYNTSVEEINVDKGTVKSINVCQNVGRDQKRIVIEHPIKKCIIATGGKSYPGTGSTGDGYSLAKSIGHKIIDVKGGLVGLKSNNRLYKNLQGLNLKNVEIKVFDNNKCIYTDFGEMLFSHFGVTGPIILSASSKINRLENLETKLKNNKIYISIDLKPALDDNVLDKRLCRDFEKNINKEFKNSLDELLPKKLIPIVIELSNIPEDKKVNQITKEEREFLVKLLKNFKININDLMPIETAIITCGGVDVKEINPKTLESKLVKGLFFAGEVMDLDALTGGFNLQIAFSTGYTAGI